MITSNHRQLLCCGHAGLRGSRGLQLAAALIVCLIGTRSLPAEDELPAAETILDRYVNVTGGRQAYERLTSRVSTGTMEFVSLNIRGLAANYQVTPAKHYSLIESEAFGNLEEGTDGEVAWANSLLGGPRLKKGPEREYALRQAPLDAPIRWREHYEKVACLAREDIDGEPCFKLLLMPNEGRPETRYYREDSGLLVRTELMLDSETGPLPAVILTGDYREIDGLLIAHKTRYIIASGFHEMCLTLESVDHNGHIADDRFAFPEDVQALVDKEKKRPGQKTR